MKQSTVTKISSITAAVLTILLPITAVLVLHSNSTIAEVVVRQDASVDASRQVSASSKLLTDSVQTFVSTGDKAWLDNYWNELDVTKSQPKAIARLKELQTPKNELDLVAKASANSMALVEAETRAMRLMLEAQGVAPEAMPKAIASWELTPEDKALTSPEKVEKARELVFSNDYWGESKKIMAPIAEFQSTLRARLQAEVTSEISKARMYTWLFIATALALAAVLAGVLFVFHKQNGKIIQRYARWLRKRDPQDISFQLRPEGLVEVCQLGEEFNNQIRQTSVIVQELRDNTNELDEAAQILANTSSQLAQATQTATDAATEASEGVESVRTHIQTVAASTEEMGASIREIASAANNASSVAEEAVSAAQGTLATVNKLSESSQLIGEVLNTITSIASQTNLLALNATIEAARAGEAGKGFAVVANEVKELASQTAEATEDIADKITSIQADAHETSVALENIAEVINRINETQSTIASAVEEQTATTNEISNSVHATADSISTIARQTQLAASSIKESSLGINETSQAAQDVRDVSHHLTEIVEKYTIARQ